MTYKVGNRIRIKATGGECRDIRTGDIYVITQVDEFRPTLPVAVEVEPGFTIRPYAWNIEPVDEGAPVPAEGLCVFCGHYMGDNDDRYGCPDCGGEGTT